MTEKHVGVSSLGITNNISHLPGEDQKIVSEIAKLFNYPSDLNLKPIAKLAKEISSLRKEVIQLTEETRETLDELDSKLSEKCDLFWMQVLTNPQPLVTVLRKRIKAKVSNVIKGFVREEEVNKRSLAIMSLFVNLLEEKRASLGIE